jgi:predicted Co/Zn/Cd cation transporter (cation efflux family)
MYISKVLKRKDAASVSIAVVMAFAFTAFLASISLRPAEFLSGIKGAHEHFGFRVLYIQPLMMLLLELLFLEISVRLIIWLRPFVVGKKK